jgi:hypothetical protein
MTTTNGLTADGRLALLARQIVVTKLVLRSPATHLTDKPFALRPEAADFQKPFEIYLRKEFVRVRIDEARNAHRWDRVAELELELIDAEQAIVRLVL